MANLLRQTFIKYIGLNMLGMMGISLYILADTFFIARALGSTGLAALNLALPVFNIVQSFGLMIGVGGAIYFLLHRHDEKGKNVFSQVVYLGGVFSLLFFLIGIFFSEPLTYALGADGETFSDTYTYLRMILLFSPFFIFNHIFQTFVRNDNAPQLAMIAMLSSSLSNTVLDYIFMFPLKMGMFGAVFATCLAPFFSMLVLSLHLYQKNNSFHLKKVRLQAHAAKRILSLGTSSFILEFATGITLFTFNIIILGISGNTGLAAYGIIANIAVVINAFFIGLGQGAQPIASRLITKKDKTGLKKILKYMFVTGLLISTLSYAILLLFSHPVVAAFNRDADPELAFLAVQGLRIYIVGYFFASINMASSAFLSAIDKPYQGITIAVLRSFILLVPIVIVLSKAFGMVGVWSSFVVTEGLVTFITLYFLKRTFSQFNRIS